MKRRPPRGFSLIELMVSLAAAVVLMAGMASAVAVSTRSLALSDTGNNARALSADVQRDLLADLQRATGFTERTTTAATFTVPDRTGDGRPETLRYAWSGTPGTPLTLQMNGGTVQNIAEDVRDFALAYRTQTLVAPVVPDESPPTIGRLLFVSGPPGLAPTFGQQVGGSGSPVIETSRDPKITLFQSWGFEVTAISADQTQTDFTTAIAKNDVIYLSSDNGISQAADRVASAAIGIVNENAAMAEPLGFYQGAGSASGTDTVMGVTSHYITQSYTSRQRVKVINTANSLQAFLNPKATGMTVLGAETTTDKINFATLAAGRKRFDGANAPGRRVQLPWAVTDLNVSSLSTDGKALLKSSLLWAVGNGSDGNSSYIPFGLTNSNDKVDYFSSSGTLMHASKVTLASRGELMELSAYVRSSSLPLRLAIYSNATGVPGVRLAQTAALNGISSESWITGAVTPIILEPGTYWLAVALSNATQRAYYDDPLTGITYQLSAMNFNSGFPATWTPGSGGSNSLIAIKQLMMNASLLALP